MGVSQRTGVGLRASDRRQLNGNGAARTQETARFSRFSALRRHAAENFRWGLLEPLTTADDRLRLPSRWQLNRRQPLFDNLVVNSCSSQFSFWEK